MTRFRSYFSRGNAARALWGSVRTSLWFLPTIMCATAFALTGGGLAFDDWLGQGSDESFPRMIYVSAPDQARELLATVLTSMVTMASLVFSITMVVLTLAAAQFGPRLIRNFMGRVQTQFVLGTFMMTSIYCLLLLASIAPGDSGESNAYLSVTIAIGLTDMACCARTEDQRVALRDQVHAVLEDAKREILNPADLQGVEQHGLQALDELQVRVSKDQP
jgi:uncharacterized membrane protein